MGTEANFTIPEEKDNYQNPYSAEDRQRLLALQGSASARTAPGATAAQAKGTSIDGSNEIEARGQQLAAISRLNDASQGKGPSAAGAQLQQGVDASLRAQQAMAASRSTGGSGALAARSVANQGSAMQGQAALQAAVLKAQEQQAAQAQYAQALQGMRSQDFQSAAAQAQLNQQTNLANAGFLQQAGLANQQAALTQTGLNDAQMRALLGMQMSSEEADREAMMAYNQKEVARFNAGQEKGARDVDRNYKIGGTALQMAGGFLTSDENAKEDVQPADDKIRQMLETIGAHDYQYKDPDAPGAAPGRHVSPMAQELERTDAGRGAVVDTPDGKKVDYGRLTGVNLAAAAHLNKRLESVESRLAKATKGKK